MEKFGVNLNKTMNQMYFDELDKVSNTPKGMK